MHFLLISYLYCLPITDMGVGYALHSLHSLWTCLMEHPDPHPFETKQAGGMIISSLFFTFTIFYCVKRKLESSVNAPNMQVMSPWVMHYHHQQVLLFYGFSGHTDLSGFYWYKPALSRVKVSSPAPTLQQQCSKLGFSRNQFQDLQYLNKLKQKR